MKCDGVFLLPGVVDESGGGGAFPVLIFTVSLISVIFLGLCLLGLKWTRDKHTRSALLVASAVRETQAKRAFLRYVSRLTASLPPPSFGCENTIIAHVRWFLCCLL